MKNLLIFLIIILFISCNNTEDKFIGIWMGDKENYYNPNEENSENTSLTQGLPILLDFKKENNLTLKVFPDRHALYSAALAKEVLIIAGVEKLSKNFDDYALLKKDYPAFARIPYNTSEFGTAVAKGNTTLLDFIQQGMNKISTVEKSAIERNGSVLIKPIMYLPCHILMIKCHFQTRQIRVTRKAF